MTILKGGASLEGGSGSAKTTLEGGASLEGRSQTTLEESTDTTPEGRAALEGGSGSSKITLESEAAVSGSVSSLSMIIITMQKRTILQ